MLALPHLLASLLLAWYGAALVGGMLIWLGWLVSRRRPPSHDDIVGVAARYRRHYGAKAEGILADHRVGASFWAGRRDRELLAAVAAQLRENAVCDRD